MTIIDKWKAITHEEINIGDKIKRVNIHADGTRAEVSGVVTSQNYAGDYMSKDGFALARKYYANTRTELSVNIPPTQEELDEAFEFPTAIGAVIRVVMENSSEERTFVHSGQVWLWSGTPYPAALREADVRRIGHNFALISEGIN